MATRSLGTLTVDLIARIGGFTSGLTKAERETDKFRRAMRQKAAEIDREFQKMGIALAAVFTGVGFAVANAVRQAGEINTLSQIANTTTDEFQRWAAATSTVGIAQDKLSDQLKDFTERIGDFTSTGGGPMADFFENIAPKIGLTAEAFQGLSGPQALQLYYNALEQAGLNQQQMSFYMESMASDTTALIPLLADGGKAMRELGDMAEQTGAIMDEKTIRSARELQMTLGIMQQQGAALHNQFIGALMPMLSDLAGEMVDVTTQTTIASDAGQAFGELLKWIAVTAVGTVSAINLVGKAIGGAFAIVDAAGVEGMSPLELITDPGKSLENAQRIYKILTDQNDEVRGVIATVQGDLTRTMDEAFGVLDGILAAGTGTGSGGAISERIKGWIDAQDSLRNALGNSRGAPSVAGATGSANKELEQQLRTARQYLLTLEDQILRVNEMTNLERLHHDIKRETVVLDADQLRTAEAMAAELDARVERERQIETALNRQNAELSAQRQLRSLILGFDTEIAGMGMGQQARAEMERRVQMQQEFADRVQQIEDQRRQALATADDDERARVQQMYDDLLAIEQVFQSQSLAAFEKYIAEKRAKEGDWTVGANRAWENYVEQAQNAAAQAENAMSSWLQGTEDALVNFVQTGKLSFSDLANSIISDLARIAVRQAATGLFGYAMQAVGGLFGGGGGSANSSIYSLSTGGSGLGLKFSDGGYTGPGGKYDPAGIVHAGEYVINAESTRKLGLGFLDRLNGYANGGYVGAPPLASVPPSSGSSQPPQVIINIHNDGQGADNAQATPGLEAFARTMQQIARAEYQKLQTRSFRQGGAAWQQMGAGVR